MLILLKNYSAKKLLLIFAKVIAMIGWGELTLIIILAIVVLGPENLSDIAKKLGKLYTEYNRARKMLELEMMYGPFPTDEIIRKLYEENKSSIVEAAKEAKDIYNQKMKD